MTTARDNTIAITQTAASSNVAAGGIVMLASSAPASGISTLRVRYTGMRGTTYTTAAPAAA